MRFSAALLLEVCCSTGEARVESVLGRVGRHVVECYEPVLVWSGHEFEEGLSVVVYAELKLLALLGLRPQCSHACSGLALVNVDHL